MMRHSKEITTRVSNNISVQRCQVSVEDIEKYPLDVEKLKSSLKVSGKGNIKKTPILLTPENKNEQSTSDQNTAPLASVNKEMESSTLFSDSLCKLLKK